MTPMKSIFLCPLSILLAACLLSPVAANSLTGCQPLNRTDCPSDPPLSGTTTAYLNNTLDGGLWKTDGGMPAYGDQGAKLSITHGRQSPTIVSRFYIFFGRVEVVMKAAKGKGIVSSMALISDDLDEIDLQIAGNETGYAHTNYFGKGNSTLDPVREKRLDVNGTTGLFHNYTVDWTKDRIQWWVDDELARELQFADAMGGDAYPQTPCALRIGVWTGGASDNNVQGVARWKKEKANYQSAPFEMTVKSIYAKDYSHGGKYYYTDKSGSFKSVAIAGGNSPFQHELDDKPKTLTEGFARLPAGAKAGIIIGIVIFAAIAITGLTWACFAHQKREREEQRVAQGAKGIETGENKKPWHFWPSRREERYQTLD